MYPTRSRPASRKRRPALQRGASSTTVCFTAMALRPPRTATARKAVTVDASGRVALGVMPMTGRSRTRLGGRHPPDEEPGRGRPHALHLDGASPLAAEPGAEAIGHLAGDLDPARDARRLHAAGHVHGVAPDVVDELAAADDARDDRSVVHADAEGHPEAPCRFDTVQRRGQLECHVGHAGRVVRRPDGHATDHHVGVADGLDLLEAVRVDQPVEDTEDLVEDGHELGGRHRRG